MKTTETHKDLAIRQYSVIFATMIFVATFMPTKFFWMPLVALLVLFITSRSWRWRFLFSVLQLSNPLLALVAFVAYAIFSSLLGDHLMQSFGKSLLLCALVGCGYLLVQNSKKLFVWFGHETEETSTSAQ